MKTQKLSFLRSVLPTLFCGLLSISVLGMSQYVSAADNNSVVEIAQKIQPVSINSADAATIADALKGVGIKKAQAIVNWRKQNGKFTSVRQLLEVKGIGEKTLAANKSRIIL